MKTILPLMRLLVVVLAGTLLVTTAFSQPGSNDPTFDPGARGGANTPIITSAIQSDGKIIVGGNFTSYNGTARNSITRVNTDGSLDASFDRGAGADQGGIVYTTAIQSDGKIIICGSFTSYNGTARNRIARLNSDGSLDATFNPGSGTNGTIRTTAIQSDGKIIIGGLFTTYNGTGRNSIARLNSDGSPDESFNPGTGNDLYGTFLTTAIQSDGKIIMGGDFRSYNGTGRNGIVRINTDGSLDATFNPGTGASGSGVSIFTTAIQPDGKVIIGGSFTSYNGTARSRIARLNSDGSLDTDFNTGTGVDGGGYPYATAVQSNGKIIVCGDFNSYNGTKRAAIARLNSDGSLDLDFNPGSAFEPSSRLIRTTAIQTDGKIIIGGDVTPFTGTFMKTIARVNSDGSYDANFNAGGANENVRATAIQSDGKIIIGGNFTFYNQTARNRIARLNTDGSLDANFSPGTGANDQIYTTTIQSDGKIIIGGNFTSDNGTARNRIARLNTDGSLDAGFNPGTGANNSIIITAIQSDGKIIIGGNFTSYNGTALNSIARLNNDGSLDAGFNPGTGANAGGIIYSTTIQSDGKIIIAGAFSSYNGTAKNNIARLNTDGSLDVSFNPGTGADDNIYTNAIQSDGKIIIGGAFSSYNGTARNRIARLNSDGSLDAGFNPGMGVGESGFIFTTAIQTDEKIIIGGGFSSYNGTARKNIARLNTDGTLDAGLNPGIGAIGADGTAYVAGTIFTTALQSDSKIIIGGDFTSYNGTARNYVARVIGGTTTSPSDYFRTITSGNWNSPATWESASDPAFTTGVVSPATFAPDVNAKAITIQNTHTVNITANVTINKTTLNSGGAILVNPNVVLTVK